MDFFGDSVVQVREAASVPHLGKRQREEEEGEGESEQGAESDLEEEEGGSRGQSSGSVAQEREGVSLLADQCCIDMEGKRGRKKRKKLSKETKELLRRQEVIITYIRGHF